MAYKFQKGLAILSGNIAPTSNNQFSIGTGDGAAYADMHASGTVYAINVGSSGDPVNAAFVAASGLTYGGTAVTATGAEMNYLDITTLGTAAASKAMTWAADSSWTASGGTCADLGTVTTADINGGNIDGTIIGAASVAAGSFAAVVGTTGTFSGVLKTDDSTDATTTTDGSLQTDGGLSVAKDAIMGNDVKLLTDAAVLSLGVGSDATLTHDGTTGLIISANPLLLSSTTDVTLDSITGDIIMADNATPQLKFDLDGDADGPVIQLQVDADDLVFKQFDGTEVFRISDDATAAVAVGLMPDANDGAYLGQAGTAFSDLFLAEGGVINWDSGDMTMTQASDVLTIAGGTLTATLTNALECDAANSGLSGTDYDGSAAVTNWAVDLNDLAGATVDVANDSIAIVDATDSSTAKESIADLVTAMAGTGLTAVAGVLNADAAGGTVTDHGDAAGTLAEGTNFSSANFSAARTWTLPASPTVGDVIVVKAPSNTSTYTLTIARAGSQTIDGATSVALYSDYGSVSFIYMDSDVWGIK